MRRLTRSLAAAVLVATVACETVTVVTIEVATVQIVPDRLTLVEGESSTLRDVVRGPSGEPLSGRDVQWSSRTPSVAPIDQGGRVTAAAAGEATVQAVVEGVVGTARVTVLPGPAVELSTEEVELAAVEGAASSSSDVAITNSGNGTLSGLSVGIVYAGDSGGWLNAGLNGTTAPTSLTLSASAATLTPGEYTATVTVRSSARPGLSASLTVRLVVSPRPPVLVLETDAVAFAAVQNGQQAATQTVQVTNGGAGTLDGLALSTVYGDAQPAGWLTATLGSVTAPTEITLRASPGGLQPGTYTATVSVSSVNAVNSPVALTVVFTVAPAGAPRQPTPSHLVPAVAGS